MPYFRRNAVITSYNFCIICESEVNSFYLINNFYSLLFFFNPLIKKVLFNNGIVRNFIFQLPNISCLIFYGFFTIRSGRNFDFRSFVFEQILTISFDYAVVVHSHGLFSKRIFCERNIKQTEHTIKMKNKILFMVKT